jgi:signal transduction histidine kinase
VPRTILLAVDQELSEALRRAVDVRIDREEMIVSTVPGALAEAIETARRDHGGTPLGVAARSSEQVLLAIEHGADEAMAFEDVGTAALHDLVDRTLLRGSLRAEGENMKLAYAHGEKLAALGTLVAGVAHEINNPLAVVALSIDVLEAQIATASETTLALRRAVLERRGLSADELARLVAKSAPVERRMDLKTLIDDTNAAVSAIRDVVADLRVFARPNDDELPDSVRVPELLNQVLRLVGMQVEAGAVLERDFPDEVPLVVVPRNRLAQVLTNVLVNAAHAIREVRRERHRVRVSIRADEDGVAISISDTGPGIPPEAIERVFDPFYTTKRVGLGTGLGLSLSRNLMRRMGGDLLLESVYGDGATFIILLPLATPEQLQAACGRGESSPRPVIARTRLSVLIVDQDERVLRAHSRLLSRHYDVLLASDEQEAIDMLASGSRADVVLADPGLTPIEESADLHAWLREHRPALAPRMVFVTPAPDSLQHARELDGCEVLGKPAPAALLLDAIARAAQK